MAEPQRDNGDRPVRVYFCSACDEMLGVEDHIRIRHEHFDEGWPAPKCRGGQFRIIEYAPTGRNLGELDRARHAVYHDGFVDGYKRGRSDERVGREPPWSVRDSAAAL